MKQPSREAMHLFFSDGTSVHELERLRRENAILRRQRGMLLRMLRKLKMRDQGTTQDERTIH